MSHKRLAELMQAQREAIDAQPEARTTRESIRSILHVLDVGEVTQAQAQRLLDYQALRWADVPAYAALYQEAAANLRQMQREEH